MLNRVELDILGQLDDTRTLDQLTEHVLMQLKEGKLNVHRDQKQVTDPAAIEQAAPELMRQMLQGFCDRGLLVG